ncbi:MAG: hypothetical protein J2P46_10485 [Zavarzinella sp.]|nr:hypothetical protein [Zavarzinella sp.]
MSDYEPPVSKGKNMAEQKRRSIQEQLRSIEQRLQNAEEYAAENVNVEGSSWLHMDDWRGKSGHPSWIKNQMIPAVKRVRAKKEKALETIDDRAKGKKLAKRRSGAS